ncbi:hypothetical protein T12_8673 [Trichinella patagoniensis]|uniref:Uncharacterized protein n=1 Tax=Trichinella patagoniensis TaxID=990121 RepID=A0A0V0YWS7_9BILA|nr:hypothetical protein T12_8673 [Trichinella patagoniensis]
MLPTPYFELNEQHLAGANERGGELSSGIPPGAAAYHHDVYAAHLLTSVLR